MTPGAVPDGRTREDAPPNLNKQSLGKLDREATRMNRANKSE
jgi:hypothetical protein